MQHELGQWIPFKDRQCSVCLLLESKATKDCIGKQFGPEERNWLLAFQEDLCDYVDGRWVNWQGTPVDNVPLLRKQAEDYVLKKEIQTMRAPHLKKKMEMEDELLTHSRYRGLNPRPFDDV